MVSPILNRNQVVDINLSREELQQFHGQHIQLALVSLIDTLRRVPLSFPQIDPLVASLANFAFYAIPLGTASRETRNSSDVTVKVNKFAVYALDSYDFNGEQQRILGQNLGLGYWKGPGNVSPTSIFTSGSTFVDNPDFRQYRENTSRGRDFNIISNVKIIPLSQPFEHRFQLPRNLR